MPSIDVAPGSGRGLRRVYGHRMGVRPWVQVGDFDLLQHPAWQMTMAERAIVVLFAGQYRPAVAVEIGTAAGGATAALARHAGHVYTIDTDESCADAVASLSNVTFVHGDSATALPALLDDLSDGDGHPVELMFIDGDHSTEAVRRDVTAALRVRPARSMLLLMHDSSNPACRAGILGVPWDSTPWTWFVDVDFVGGSVTDGEVWGGLAMAQLVPQEREGPVPVVESGRATFDALNG